MSMCLPWPLHTYPGEFSDLSSEGPEKHLNWPCSGSADPPITLHTFVQHGKHSHGELLGTSRVPWSGQSKNPDAHMYTRIQERNLGHISQQLSTTKRALADPTRAALLCKQLPGPGPGPGPQQGEGPRISHLFVGSGSWEKEENHHRLLVSGALQFLAEEAPLRHSRITGAQWWVLLGPAVTTIAGLNTFLQPPAPKLTCTLTNISAAGYFFWKQWAPVSS